MASTAVTMPSPQHRRFNPDRIFFPLMSLIVFATVLIGFAHTYYLAGMVRAPLPNRLIHFHGAVFTLWVLLVMVQTALVSAKKIRIHRALGMYGFGLAVAMVVLGSLAARDSMQRGFVPPGYPGNAYSFFITPFVSMILFSVLVFAAYKTRFRPLAHKRLITLATLSLLDAAIARWPFGFMHHGPLVPNLIYAGLALSLVVYDLAVLRRVERATWMGVLFVLVLHFAEVPIGMTAAWQHFAMKIAGA